MRRGGVARPLVLVLVLMAWHELSDRLSDRLGIETESFESAYKLPMIAVGILVACGGIVGLGCCWWGRSSLRELGWTFARPLALLSVGSALTALMVGMVFAVYAILGGVDGMRELAGAIASLSIAQRAFFAFMGVKNAFVEETLFRGDVMPVLAQKIGVPAAIVVSSAIFALYHRTLEPIPLVMKLLFGLLLALATVRTRSLVPSAIAHAGMWAIVANN